MYTTVTLCTHVYYSHTLYTYILQSHSHSVSLSYTLFFGEQFRNFKHLWLSDVFIPNQFK